MSVKGCKKTRVKLSGVSGRKGYYDCTRLSAGYIEHFLTAFSRASLTECYSLQLVSFVGCPGFISAAVTNTMTKSSFGEKRNHFSTGSGHHWGYLVQELEVQPSPIVACCLSGRLMFSLPRTTYHRKVTSPNGLGPGTSVHNQDNLCWMPTGRLCPVDEENYVGQNLLLQC